MRAGFTLVELVMIIVVIGIMAAVAIPKVSGVLEEAKRTGTLEEMLALRRAIIGDASNIQAGHNVSRGYEGDVGALPSALTDLQTKPGGVSAWNRHTGTGWNGPYMGSAADYLTDVWGNSYSYDSGARTITSTGGGGTQIVVDF